MKDVRKLKLEELNRVGVEDFKSQAKIPIAVVLDNFRSGLNVGSFFRTSDAFSLEKIYLCGITAAPPHKEILKTAIGANHSVEWEYHQSTKDIVDYLNTEDYHIIGIEQTTASVPLSSFEILPNSKYALVFGNEVDGLSKEVLPAIHTFIEIQQFGTKHSLNVSVCGGIVIYAFARAHFD